MIWMLLSNVLAILMLFISLNRKKRRSSLIVALLLSVIFLVGCKEEEFKIKNIEIELGQQVSDDVMDYLVISSENVENFTETAKLDTSNIDNMKVGNYMAIIEHKGRKISIPVSVVDTEPPCIAEKLIQIEEGKIIKVSEVAFATDLSGVDIVFIDDGKETDTLETKLGMTITVKATDLYGNISFKEIVPYIVERKSVSDNSITEHINILEDMDDGMENAALLKYYKDDIQVVKDMGSESGIKIRYYETDLNDDGLQDMIVYIRSAYHSGTLGDRFEILMNHERTYRSVSHITIGLFTEDMEVLGCVYLLKEKTNDYYDLEVIGDDNIHFFLRYDRGKYQYVGIK